MSRVPAARLDALLADQRASLAARDTSTWEQKAARILADCHPKQRAFVEDPAERLVALTSRGCGKTTGGRARLLLRAMRTPRAKCLFVATTRAQAIDLMWNELKKVCEKLGIEAKWNETRLRCTLVRNRSTITLVGADDKREIEKLRGLPFHEVGIDEGASHPTQLLEHLVLRIISPRLGDYGGVLWIVGTPGHHLGGLFYDLTRPGSEISQRYDERDPDEPYTGWSLHTWTLQDGAATVPAMARLWAAALVEKKRNGWGDDHPVWLREYLGRWAADDTENVYRYRPHTEDGKPWNQWDPPRNPATGLAELPAGGDWQYVYALDMGHSDPLALNIFAFDPNYDQKLRHIYCFEKRGMYARTIAELLLGPDLDPDDPDGLFGATGWPSAAVADLAGLGGAVLDELRDVYGVRFEAAEKKQKHDAIELTNGDLVDGRILVLKKSPLEEQLLGLQWWPDRTGTLKENKAQPNHSADCLVYARRAVAHQFAGPAQDIAAQGTAPRAVRDATQQDRAELDRVFAKTREDDFRSVLGDDSGYYHDPVWG